MSTVAAQLDSFLWVVKTIIAKKARRSKRSRGGAGPDLPGSGVSLRENRPCGVREKVLAAVGAFLITTFGGVFTFPCGLVWFYTLGGLVKSSTAREDHE